MSTSTGTALAQPAQRPPSTTTVDLDSRSNSLSPIAIVNALCIPTPSHPIHSNHVDPLYHTVFQASETERAQAMKTAVAAQQLKEWHAELLAWKWPSRKDQKLGKGFQSRCTATPTKPMVSTPANNKEYLGSLPKTIVLQHEQRLNQIRADLDDLSIQELKDLVSPTNTFEPATLGGPPLSDFSAIVANIMSQAIPCLSKVTGLLSDWGARVTVLKQIPLFLTRLDAVEAHIEAALKSVRAKDTNVGLARASFEETKDSLAYHVSLLDAKLDQMRRCLAGHQDSLPEMWIARMTEMNANFAQWTTELQRKLSYMDWMREHMISSLEEPILAGHAPPMITANRVKRPRIIPIAGRTSLPQRHVRSLDLPRNHSRGMSGSLCSHLPWSDRQVVATAGPDGTSGALPWNVVYDQQKARQSWSAAYQRVPSPPPPAALTSSSAIPPMAKGCSASDTLATESESTLMALADQSRRAVRSARDKAAITPESSRALSSYKDIERPRVHDVKATLESVSEALHHHQRRSLGYQSQSVASTQVKDQLLSLDVPRESPKRRKSEVSVADSVQSGAFSGISTPEIFEATTVEARVGPQGVRHWVRTSPDPILPSDYAPHLDEASLGQFEWPAHQQEPAPSMQIRNSQLMTDEVRIAASPMPSPILRDAGALPSMDQLPRYRVRSILVNRKDSASSSLISPISSVHSSEPSSRSVSPLEDGASQSMSTKSPEFGHTRHYAYREGFQFPGPSLSHDPHSVDAQPGPPSTSRISNRPPSASPGLNVVVPCATTGRALPATVAARSLTNSESSTRQDLPQSDDVLESRIQSLISCIPGPIYLLSDLTSQFPTHSPTMTSSHAQESESSIILRPVRLARGQSAAQGSNPKSHVRLFHLVRSAEASFRPPTNLFVRLAGENADQLLVQVAGGGGRWNDLGDYLRRYSKESTSVLNEGRFTSNGVSGRSPWTGSGSLPKPASASLSPTRQSFGDARHSPARHQPQSPASSRGSPTSPKQARGRLALGTRSSGHYEHSPTAHRSSAGRRDDSHLAFTAALAMPSTAEPGANRISEPLEGSIPASNLFHPRLIGQAKGGVPEDAAPAPPFGLSSAASMFSNPSYGVAVAGVAVKVGPESKRGDSYGGSSSGKFGNGIGIGGIRRVFLSRKAIVT